MSTAILRGISAALLATLLTLIAGLVWVELELGEFNSAVLVDVAVIISSAVAGYKAGKDGRLWLLGGLAGGGYMGVAILLLALFYPLSFWGVIQVLGQGILIGSIGGVIGAGGFAGGFSGRYGVPRSYSRRSYSNYYEPWYGGSRPVCDLEPKRPEQVPDHHINDWPDVEAEESTPAQGIYPAGNLQRSHGRWWEEEVQRPKEV